MSEFLPLLEAVMPCPIKNEEPELLLSQEEDEHSLVAEAGEGSGEEVRAQETWFWENMTLWAKLGSKTSFLVIGWDNL